MSDVEKIFKEYDADGDGHISAKELKTALTEMEIIPTDALIQEIMNHYDEDGNGKLELDEFAALVGDLKKFGEADAEEVLGMFNAIDTDQSGYIDEEELRQAMAAKFDTDEQTIKAMVKVADKDGDGKISVSEFLAIILSLNDTDDPKTVFDQFDVDGDGKVSVSELKALMMALNINPRDSFIKELMKQYDRDGNNLLEFKEFEKMIQDFKHMEEADPEELLKMFNDADTDKSGFLDNDEEFAKIAETMSGEKLSGEVLDTIIAEADVNGDGKISISEFVAVVESFQH